MEVAVVGSVTVVDKTLVGRLTVTLVDVSLRDEPGTLMEVDILDGGFDDGELVCEGPLEEVGLLVVDCPAPVLGCDDEPGGFPEGVGVVDTDPGTLEVTTDVEVCVRNELCTIVVLGFVKSTGHASALTKARLAISQFEDSSAGKPAKMPSGQL